MPEADGIHKPTESDKYNNSVLNSITLSRSIEPAL